MELKALFFNRILLGLRGVQWLFGGVRHLLAGINYFGGVGLFGRAIRRVCRFGAVAGGEGNGYQGR